MGLHKRCGSYARLLCVVSTKIVFWQICNKCLCIYIRAQIIHYNHFLSDSETTLLHSRLDVSSFSSLLQAQGEN